MFRKGAALLLTVLLMAALLTGCGQQSVDSGQPAGPDKQEQASLSDNESQEPAASNEAGKRTIADGNGRQVEIPETVESIVCVGVGALRYTCYVGGQDLVTGVEDYETKAGMSRLYNYVNFDKFESLPVTGTNGEPFVEEIINVDPQVILLSSYAKVDPDELQ